jgi:antitoxin component YwqK of YwqJK toxin-antitoxin module
MRKFILMIAVLPFLSSALMAQKNSGKDTVFNQVDAKGLKQGFWKAKYSNGNIKYEGFFINNKPAGTMKRYYEEGPIKAVLVFDKNGETSKAKIYYNNGELIGEGNYAGNVKDSTWNYYSYYDKVLSCKETYNKGKKNGITRNYYPKGNLSEELEWKNDLKDGIWIQYFQNGQKKLVSKYVQNIRTGDFMMYYDTGNLEVNGHYANNLMQGKWTRYDEKGEVKSIIDYVNGKPLNPEVIDKKDQEFFKMVEDNKGRFSEPDINDFDPSKHQSPKNLQK